jgi:hypothetical protein
MEANKLRTGFLRRRAPRVIPLLLLGATACGDASLTATSRFPRNGKDDHGATIRVGTEDRARTADESGDR